MNSIFTHEHNIFRDTVRKFIEKEMEPRLKAWRNRGVLTGTYGTKLPMQDYSVYVSRKSMAGLAEMTSLTSFCPRNWDTTPVARF